MERESHDEVRVLGRLEPFVEAADPVEDVSADTDARDVANVVRNQQLRQWVDDPRLGRLGAPAGEEPRARAGKDRCRMAIERVHEHRAVPPGASDRRSRGTPRARPPRSRAPRSGPPPSRGSPARRTGYGRRRALAPQPFRPSNRRRPRSARGHGTSVRERSQRRGSRARAAETLGPRRTSWANPAPAPSLRERRAPPAPPAAAGDTVARCGSSRS